MKKSFTLLCILALSLTTVSVYANMVTIPDPESGTTISTTTYLPIAINAGTSNQSAGCYSVSQQLYYASEMNDNSTKPSSTTINAITFYYDGGPTFSRNLHVWVNNTSMENFPTPEDSSTPNFVDPGTKVFEGDVYLEDQYPSVSQYTITFETPYVWDGTSNIVITIFDATGKFNSKDDYPSFGTVYTPKTEMFADEGKVRFLHKISRDKNFDNAGWTMNNLAASTAYSITPANRKYANRITFTFAAAAVVPATPSDLAVSSVTSSSASLSWSAVEGATSYDLQQSANGSDWSTLASGETGTSYSWTDLSAASTQYARIRATNANGSSAWSDAVTVTTDAVYAYDEITFDKWSSTTSMPTTGNYYLNDDVALNPYVPTTITLTGNLNLCLNGHTANLYGTKIVVPSSKTLTIYSKEDGGTLTGFVASEIGGSEDYTTALIVVKSGGALVLKEGTIENTYEPDKDGSSYAIYSNGTVRLSGDVLINSNSADIYLYASNVITLDAAISNSAKHTVYKNGGAFTSGWSTYMSGEAPRDYFESANSSKSICLKEGEAALRNLLNLSESSTNSSIGTNSGQTVDVNLTRSLTSSQYNTFCLPFALSDAQLQAAFGSGYDLEEFVGASLDGDQLNLTFNKVTSLVAGKPYLLQPSEDVVNPSFEGVTIGATSPDNQTSDPYISFYGIYSPTVLEGGNQNILFLGAENELFWPEATESLKGFRAYFEIKDGVSKIAKRARIINKEEAPTSLENVQGDNVQRTKYIENGQLFILYNGAKYNVQGQVIK